MRRIRAHLAQLGAITAALFALNVGVPRAALFYHSHAGGDHLHVHPDEDGAAELIAELDEHHHHHHHHGHGDGGAAHEHATAAAHQPRVATSDPTAPVALQHDGGPTTGHWHRQDHFQRALAAAPTLVATCTPLIWLRDTVPNGVGRISARELRARGPPCLFAPLISI